MFQIYYKAGYFTYETEDVNIRGGMVATFVGNKKIGICQPHQLPIGFFIDDFNPTNLVSNPRISVAIGCGDYITDTIEKGTYKIRDLLYCGVEGILTNNPIYRGNPVIGIVNEIEEAYIGFLGTFDNLESVAVLPEKKVRKKPKSNNKFNRYTALSRRK